MKTTRTLHAVHDQDGNIRSLFTVASALGARAMMTPAAGHSVSQVDPGNLKLPDEIRNEDDVNRVREAAKKLRVDTSGIGRLIHRK